MNIDYEFWIKEFLDNSPIYKVCWQKSRFHLYEHYLDQDLASWGEDNYQLTYKGNHGICEMLLQQFNIQTTLAISEKPQDLYEIRSLSQELQ